MALRSDNSVLWLVLGLSLGFVAVRRIVRDLYQVRELTEITQPENDERMISQGTEDALKLETLQKLTESPSYELRGASLRIISERATKESSRDILLKDLASKSKRRRNRALNAIHFLVSSRALSRSSISPRLKDLPTFTALVDCLCTFLEEHTVTADTITTESPILPKTRPPGEKKALTTLNMLLVENIPAALEAGVVSRWLANYPFPCLRKEDDNDNNNNNSKTTDNKNNDNNNGSTTNKYRRKDVVWLMKTYWLDDTLMSSIITTLVSNTDGIRQLRKHGLMGSLMEEEHDLLDDNPDDDAERGDGHDTDSDVWMVNGESTAGTAGTAGGRSGGSGGHRRGWTSLAEHDDVVTSAEDQEEESFEQTLRRRRREAMVFSENGGPIGSDNIIQPLII